MPSKTRIIAEVASNHGGSLKIAKEMIRVAAEIGVDYIKFQSWQARKMRRDDPQYDWFLRSELSDDAHHELMEECQNRGIRFLTSCFDIERVEFLSRLGLKEIKVPSPDAASYRMIDKLKDKFEHLIISTGMTHEEELRKTVDLLSGHNFTLLHCVSLYPTPLEQVNLLRMDWLKQFTPSIGYSDHCIGIEAMKLAIARGAKHVEKHFTLGEGKAARSLPWDATPGEMEKIVTFAQDCRSMLGEGRSELNEEEIKSRERYIGRFGDNR